MRDLQRQFEAGPKTSKALLESAFETLNSTIEELRVAEEELRQQNEALIAAHDAVETWRHHYQDLFESAPDAYLVTDLDGIVQDANQSAVRLLELSRRFLKGKSLTSLTMRPSASLSVSAIPFSW